MIGEAKINAFLAKLASKSHTPGGGSVAALAGAMGGALVSMVGNLSVKKDVENSKEFADIIAKSQNEANELELLIKLDIEAFDDVMDAYALPKTNEEEKEIRIEAIQRALIKATCSPMRIMEHSFEIIKLAKRVAEIGNIHAVSDAGVASSMSRAAIESAYFNILINRGSIKDKSIVSDIEKRSSEIMANLDKWHNETVEIVKGRIG